MTGNDNVILPKLWTEYLREMWNRSVPTDYPTTDTEFSLNFGDNKPAVVQMESNLDTEESIIVDAVQDTEFVSKYLGVFEVEGVPGEKVLVSPEKVDDDPMARAIAMHYNAETDSWTELENTVIENGYVYSTVEDFSPIAVFIVKRDIESVTEASLMNGKTCIVCNGNPVKIYTDAEDGNVYVQNTVTGIKFPFEAGNILIGGSIDGTYVKKVNIYGDQFVRGASHIYAGSCNTKAKTEQIVYAGSVNVKLSNCTIGAVTCSAGAVRTDEFNLTLDTVRTALIGSGESFAHGVYEKDANTFDECQTSTAPYWLKKVVYNFNNSTINNIYTGGTCGYTRTEDCTVNIDGCTVYEYLLLCGSNGYLGNCKAKITNTTGHMLQSTNRGIVDNVDVSIDNSTFDYVFVAGDNTDSTVTGIVNKVAMDIGKGTYRLLAPGTSGGIELTDNSIVKYVKYSRSADITFSENAKTVLGEKLIVK